MRSSHFKREVLTSNEIREHLIGGRGCSPHPPTRNSRLSLEMRTSHFKREVLVYLLKLDNLSPHPWRELLVSRLKWEHLISAEKFSFLIYKTCSMYFFSLGDRVGRASIFTFINSIFKNPPLALHCYLSSPWPGGRTATSTVQDTCGVDPEESLKKCLPFKVCIRNNQSKDQREFQGRYPSYKLKGM